LDSQGKAEAISAEGNNAADWVVETNKLSVQALLSHQIVSFDVPLEHQPDSALQSVGIGRAAGRVAAAFGVSI
jgi:hypothetical protein